MARHPHNGPSRINRIIYAKHRRDKTDISADGKSDLLGTVDRIQVPLLGSADTYSHKPCGPQNTVCPEDSVGGSDVTVEKRESDATPGVAVQTVIQVVDTNSNTLWRSIGTEFPPTISNSLFGVVTIPGISVTALKDTSSDVTTGAVDHHMLTPPATSSPTTAPTATASTSTAATTSSKQLLPPVSSPKASAPASSKSHSPLPPDVSTTSTVLGTPIVDIVNSSTSSYLDSSTSRSSYTSYVTSHGPSSSINRLAGTASPTPTSSSSSSSTGSGLSPSTKTPQIVGGVVGSVAGVAVLILLLLVILRRRQFLAFFQRKSADTLPSEPASYFAPAFMKRWRTSTMTTRTDSTADTNTTERGFQKVSGRKIPPVLTHGGDGYGGGLEGDSPTIPDSLIGITPASPVGGPPPSSPHGMPLDSNVVREADESLSPVPPSNAQIPVASSVRFGNPTPVTQSSLLPQPQSAIPGSPTRPDGVGRSNPSFDGSRSSRFTESLDL
ncbi:hypothetical protein N7468_004562 [Penicillium chermesinum]|uniref:Mid2 domain-containing protein n=1 Tax=Penicillium chermesinum TaxID=63820 RepID=A0A9W9P8P1_9EURO|nr:uncharacterized protein N7468_004562 [Penicillium chermesinum]KAJ5239943.1 hypothetical protein N7468_004562 [Penicillium chermesinum]